ncbi:hypothetical protein [Arthrobacter sp. H5]|uniref:hypothetical protein n=1 Tax=Arthrobacter sp. H5 TaxID=1267973 RepID=UPI0004B5A0AC|nr:hypothetical protein [Arthrobacter sp. H5]
MDKDQEEPQDKDPETINPKGGSPTFPNLPSSHPTGDTREFGGSFDETEHHSQNDLAHQEKDTGKDA